MTMFDDALSLFSCLPIYPLLFFFFLPRPYHLPENFIRTIYHYFPNNKTFIFLASLSDLNRILFLFCSSFLGYHPG